MAALPPFRALEAHDKRKSFDLDRLNKALRQIRTGYLDSRAPFTEDDRNRLLEDQDHLPLKIVKAKQPKRQRPPTIRLPRRYPRY